jgi:uncharacterized protein (TIGR03437 family)
VSFTTVGADLLPQDNVEGKPPFGAELAGYSVLLNDQPIPLISLHVVRAEPYLPVALSLVAQIPWGTPPGAVRIRVKRPVASFFPAGLQSFDVFSKAPAFFVCCDDNHMVAAHQDFTALVTSGNPARPGEIIHAYMTGLGPVNGPVADGILTPLEALLWVADLPTCTLHSRQFVGSLRVWFAGLAPALIGVYQVSFQIPGNAPQDVSAAIGCGGGRGALPIGSRLN